MKHSLLSMAVLCCYFVASSQTVITSDDFESYTAGDLVADVSAGVWSTWDGTPGGSADAPVSSDYASSGSNSLHLTGVAGGGDQDIILPIGDYYGGVYDLEWKMLIPADSVSGGYFNVMHEYNVGGPYQWAFEAYISQSGDFTADINNTPITASTNPGVWNDFKLSVDLDNSLAELSINGTSVNSWPWDTQGDGTAGQNRLMVMNFYSAAPTGEPCSYYVDDIVITQVSSGVGINENTAAHTLSTFPNPVNAQLNIELAGFDPATAVMRLLDVTGKQVELDLPIISAATVQTLRVNVADLSNGVYFLSVVDGEQEMVEKFVKQ